MTILKPGTILNRLYEKLQPAAKNRRIAALSLGLCYAAVQLDNNAAGLAAILPEAKSSVAAIREKIALWQNHSVREILKYLLEAENGIERALGLATANALINPVIDDTENREATTLFNLRRGEKVAMVGLFSPLVERIRATGAILTVIEKNPQRLDLLSEVDKKKALRECDVAIITATTLLNNTFAEIIGGLGAPRHVALIGPSTPLLPEIFQDTPINHLGGATIAYSDKVMQIITADGGTPALRPYLRFVNLTRK